MQARYVSAGEVLKTAVVEGSAHCFELEEVARGEKKTRRRPLQLPV